MGSIKLKHLYMSSKPTIKIQTTEKKFKRISKEKLKQFKEYITLDLTKSFVQLNSKT